MQVSKAGWGVVLAACALAAPAGATHRKVDHHAAKHQTAAPAHHGKSHHEAKPAHHGRADRHASRKAIEPRKPAGAGGATSVPAGGIRLYCGPGRSPLMVRKMTQGAGTTVTVICR